MEKKIEYVYCLRTCDKNMKSYGGFRWPKIGMVAAPDWSDAKECGKGLHGLLWGEGDGGLLNWNTDAVWMVVKVQKDLIVDLDQKVKFPKCEVVFCGDKKDAAALIYEKSPNKNIKCCAGTATAGDAGTATAGYAGTATAGYAGTATAGDAGTATAGYAGTATAGACGTATAGARGTATAGYAGTATAGYAGTATAGDEGYILIRYYCEEKKTWRIKGCAIGENGIKPNVKYKLNDKHEFEEVK